MSRTTPIIVAATFMAAAAAFCTSKLSAAEIAFWEEDGDTGKTTAVRITGKIEPVDGKTFERGLEKYLERGVIVRAVDLRSRGGSVEAAMEIGRMVRKLGLATFTPLHLSGKWSKKGMIFDPNSGVNECVDLDSLDLVTGKGDPNCECTSACALIWAAGVVRLGNRVGFHRPYLDKDQIKGLSFSQTETAQHQLLQETRAFLAEMGLPQTIISRMAGASSQDIYFLERNPLHRDRYEYEPALEEWLLAKCDTRLNDKEFDAKSHLEMVRDRGDIDAYQRIALEALEKRHAQWGTCSSHWILEFQRERQARR